MRSFESMIESNRWRMGSKSGRACNSFVLTEFCCRTQSRAFCPITSSSQRYGSSELADADAPAIDSVWADADSAELAAVSKTSANTRGVFKPWYFIRLFFHWFPLPVHEEFYTDLETPHVESRTWPLRR